QLLDFILFMLALFLSGTVAAQSYTAQNTGLISSAKGNQDTLANIFQPLEPLIFLENVQGSTEFSDAIRDKVIVSNTAELFEWMEFVDSLKNEWFADSLSAHFQSPTLQKSLGEEKAQREQWVVFWLIFLVFLLGVIRYVFSGYVSFLIYSYYQDA